jgi:hypothetical protein
MDLQGLLNQALNGDAVNQLSQTLGTDQNTTSSAVQAALPMMLGALARNSATPEGASSLLGALDRDHDGSVLDNVAGLLNNAGAGSGSSILAHIFGEKRAAIENGVSQVSGLDAGSVGKLLPMLAPIVMGALGRTRQQHGLDAGALSGLLGGQAEQLGASASPMLGMLSQLLDSNNDGSALDDIARMAAKMFGRGK